MVKKVSLGDLGSELDKILNEIEEKEIKALDQAYRATAIDRLGAVMIQTPVDKGRLRGAWMFAENYNSAETGRASKTKGPSYIRKQLTGKTMLGKKWYFYNNLPYAGTVEFGGFPNPVKKGSWNKNRKRYEIKSINGFSEQATKGMLRVNLLSFASRLRKAWSAKRRGNNV